VAVASSGPYANHLHLAAVKKITVSAPHHSMRVIVSSKIISILFFLDMLV